MLVCFTKLTKEISFFPSSSYTFNTRFLYSIKFSRFYLLQINIHTSIMELSLRLYISEGGLYWNNISIKINQNSDSDRFESVLYRRQWIFFFCRVEWSEDNKLQNIVVIFSRISLSRSMINCLHKNEPNKRLIDLYGSLGKTHHFSIDITNTQNPKSKCKKNESKSCMCSSL